MEESWSDERREGKDLKNLNERLLYNILDFSRVVDPFLTNKLLNYSLSTSCSKFGSGDRLLLPPTLVYGRSVG